MEKLPSLPDKPADKSASLERDQAILQEFSPEEQALILERQRVLSSLAYFIGKDFNIPVELNEPGEGWRWNFKENIIRIDPKDLLEKPMDYLRFVICHEAGHRRITRADFIPIEIWTQPGFSWMMNCIEDPRENNFVAEVYPRVRDYMNFSYEFDNELADKAKEEGRKKMGFVPRFIKAGLEYIQQWFREANGKPFEINADLPEEVKQVVADTLEAAQDSWLRYPSREEADESEELIRQYAEVSYEINRDKVWPEFKKLVELDIIDAKTQKALQDIAKEHQVKQKDESVEPTEPKLSGVELPEQLKERLTPEEIDELNKEIIGAIERGIDQAEKGPLLEGEERPVPEPVIDLEALSDEIKKKIVDYIDSLQKEEQERLEALARALLKELEEDLDRALQGKLVEEPGEGGEEVEVESEPESTPESEPKPESKPKESQKDEEPKKSNVSADAVKVSEPPLEKQERAYGERVISDKLKELLEQEANAYEKYRREVLPLIDQLEQDLRQIFVERKLHAWQGGQKSGKRIDVKKRIQEKAKGVPVMESRAWEKREAPKEKDYAISVLVDISGSMFWDNKSVEALKSIIVLAEVLNRLGISVEILGFNDKIKNYQVFDESMSDQVRERIGEMLKDAAEKRCEMCRMDHNATDIGWATETAADALAKQKAEHKFLITLSDYLLEDSWNRKGDYKLDKVIERILDKTDVRMVGLGIGNESLDLTKFYPNSIANVDAKEMAAKLADLIKEVIANYNNF